MQSQTFCDFLMAFFDPLLTMKDLFMNSPHWASWDSHQAPQLSPWALPSISAMAPRHHKSGEIRKPNYHKFKVPCYGSHYVLLDSIGLFSLFIHIDFSFCYVPCSLIFLAAWIQARTSNASPTLCDIQNTIRHRTHMWHWSWSHSLPCFLQPPAIKIAICAF